MCFSKFSAVLFLLLIYFVGEEFKNTDPMLLNLQQLFIHSRNNIFHRISYDIGKKMYIV